jgi:hypothetical protein
VLELLSSNLSILLSIGTYEPWFVAMIQECLEITARVEAGLKNYLEDQTKILLDIQRLSRFFSTELASKAFYNGSPENWEEFLEKTPDGLILNSDWQDSFEIFLNNHEFYLDLSNLPRVDFGMVDD